MRAKRTSQAWKHNLASRAAIIATNASGDTSNCDTIGKHVPAQVMHHKRTLALWPTHGLPAARRQHNAAASPPRELSARHQNKVKIFVVYVLCWIWKAGNTAACGQARAQHAYSFGDDGSSLCYGHAT